MVVSGQTDCLGVAGVLAGVAACSYGQLLEMIKLTRIDIVLCLNVSWNNQARPRTQCKVLSGGIGGSFSRRMP